MIVVFKMQVSVACDATIRSLTEVKSSWNRGLFWLGSLIGQLLFFHVTDIVEVEHV